ncbi:MAG TPA: L,D-transpeptidase [Candidatus Saccharimonadales bacterium]|jgi:lipoprotein-anchoring transpeptidase ErfK/SrfK
MFFKILKILAVVVLIVGIGSVVYADTHHSDKTPANTTSDIKVASSGQPSSTAATTPVNPCSSNDLDQLILVSISQRHLWACSSTTVSYSSPAVTGMEFLAADLTPTGTYHIYAKETDVHLIGHDSTGSWDDFVNYWMPFLDNQYGAYGFHDATWRPANAFGNISPDSSNASHGCVECPLATAAWLYNWAPVGTTVTIES